MASNDKIITVIGGTGAQGRPVIQALLENRSQYKVRVLTRNATHPLARELVSKYGAEIVEGGVNDEKALSKALEGAYGAFVNTDSFTIGEIAELHAGIRIYELARRAGVKHFVWSSLEYKLKENGYDEAYNAPHYSGKARVWEFIKSQALTNSGGMVCTALITGPYMESLGSVYAPLGQRKRDGAVVFALPWGEPGSGIRFPFIALADLAFFARWIFDNPPPLSSPAHEVPIISQFVTGQEVAEAFERATGKHAVYVPLTHEEFIEGVSGKDALIGPPGDPASKTLGEVFRAGLKIWTGPGQLVRDMDWIRSINPGTLDVERWMRESGYDGQPKELLKAFEGNEGRRTNDAKNLLS